MIDVLKPMVFPGNPDLKILSLSLIIIFVDDHVYKINAAKLNPFILNFVFYF